MNSSSTINILDIGSGKIQCLITQVASDGLLEVIGYSHRETPTSLLNQGHIINMDKTAMMIREAVNGAEVMAGIEVDEFYVNVPGILCRGVRSHGLISVTVKEGGEKKVTMPDVERVIDSAESTPLHPDHVIIHSIPVEFKVDGRKVEEDPIGMVGTRLETDVYLITCPKGVLDTLNKAVNKAGYELCDIVFESLASAESVLSEEEKRSGSLVVDVGANSTCAVLYAGNSINNVCSIPVGGDSLTRDLSVGVSTTLVEAEEIKRTHGVLDYQMVDREKVITVKLIAYQKKTHISQLAVFQILEARMTEIFELVKRELKNSQASFPLGCCVVVTGGVANLPGIEILARNVFNQSVRVGYPLRVKELDDKVINPSFSTALGMAQVIATKEGMFQEEDDRIDGEGVFKKIGISIKKFFN